MKNRLLGEGESNPKQRETIILIQEINTVSDQSHSSGGGEKWADSEYFEGRINRVYYFTIGLQMKV